MAGVVLVSAAFLLALGVGLSLLVLVEADPIELLIQAFQRLSAADFPQRAHSAVAGLDIRMKVLLMATVVVMVLSLMRGRDLLRLATSY